MEKLILCIVKIFLNGRRNRPFFFHSRRQSPDLKQFLEGLEACGQLVVADELMRHLSALKSCLSFFVLSRCKLRFEGGL